MYESEARNLRQFMQYVIENAPIDDPEQDLVNEVYDTENVNLQDLLVYIIGLVDQDRLDEVCSWWKNLGNKLPEIYLGDVYE